ncbi:MAG TPA: GcrA family cell cycle regulator [Bradyrhizobium sp.]|uniref:GcrA family cell cycle regulator n=1 Tax=Bradyrhizobium sp. TaxID=376 RepID=UPI002C3ED3B7|nr:GcrA family cell cycle regulator [Bradyrhizobium sp.]HLZ06927.1 GcrA family cell cycle regulator [Bradyrhizobium sp.]
MQSMSWRPEHCAALTDFVAAGLSFSRAADAINARFGTAYTRSAVIGRARRMKLAVPARPERGPELKPPKTKQAKAGSRKSGEGRAGQACPAAPVRQQSEPVRLRCVGIQPRLVSLAELSDGDCRYPYGGDKEGEAITFCGHPRFRRSSYCAPHFHLTRGPRIEDDRPAGPFVLRLVEAA